jgi:allophanate hydrolase subunit 2
MHLANALLDNEGSCAVIELTLGGAKIRCWSDTQVAVTGADASLPCAGEQRPMNTATRMSAGDTIEVGVPSAGLRTYIAVRGGVDVPPVLGSRSTDTMSWLGPARIVTGTTLPIGAVRVGNRPRVP